MVLAHAKLSGTMLGHSSTVRLAPLCKRISAQLMEMSLALFGQRYIFLSFMYIKYIFYIYYVLLYSILLNLYFICILYCKLFIF